ncbi:MAG: hypothetical protein WA999_03540 [Spirulinaceae cyanobacterium]
MSKFKGIFDAAKDKEEKPSPKKGRPKGKRSNPNYEQVSAYIKKQTYTKVKIALLEQGKEQDFSELVETLLNEWLSK